MTNQEHDELRIYKDLGKILKRTRKYHCITQLEMSIALGIQRTSVSNIERGKQRAPIHIYYYAFRYMDELEKLSNIMKDKYL